MGLLNDLWWLSGIVLAAPVAIIGVEFVGGGNLPMGVAFLVVAGLVLLLPEYVKRRLFGNATSRLEAVPLAGRRFREEE